MIKIKNFIFNPLQENTFVLSDETGECIIIDAGCYFNEEKENLESYISSNNLTPTRLVLTHGHFDHVLGSHFVYNKFKTIVSANSEDIPLIEEAQSHGLKYGMKIESPPAINEYLKEDDMVRFGKSALKVFQVPGHSPGSIALYCQEQNFVIVGDVLFKGSIGRTDMLYGDYDQLRKSIFTKLMTLPPDTIVFPGHGPSTTIHEEALSNPFLV
jgi:glyoxylase-like metal-dependent hydrolase (beta-lactamase superfamily II)